MSKKSVLCFTLKELNALIQDENARVVLQRSIRKIPLQPYCLSDLQASIHELLDANLAKFDHELKGMLLSYKNIKIVKNVANVLYDDSRLYLTIQADFYLFMPEVGCVLRGIVNKRSADHIGCLVHKAFNVSIPRPECETDGDWQGYYVEIGQEVLFRVESLDLTGSLPYMLGHLLDLGSLSGSLNETFDEQKGTEKDDIIAAISKFNGLLEQHEDPRASVSTAEHKKKKKPKKYADVESGGNVQDPVFLKCERYNSILEEDDQVHDENYSLLKTSKKKKRKNTDQTAPLKQEEQAYKIGNKRGTNYHNQQEEEQPQYEEQIVHSEKQIDNSYDLQAFYHLNSTANLKKKKRKYGEAFDDNQNDDENHTLSIQNEDVKHKKKKSKKEKHSIEMPNADETVEADFGVDTSQEFTYQDKKRKKKKKRDVTEEITADLREENEFPRKAGYDNDMANDRLLTTTPDSNNTSEELITEILFNQEHVKKLGKKVKPLVTTELVTSTPFERKTKKVNSFSDSISGSQFSAICGTNSYSDFKQSNVLQSVDHFSLLHSPIFKEKHPKKDKESSPAIQSDTVPQKVKKLKKEKRHSSTQQSPDKTISEDYQNSARHHVLYHPERSLPWSDTENLMSGATTHPSSCNTSLTDAQETEHKNEKGDSADKSNKHLIQSGLESYVERKMNMSKKENRLSIKKKDGIGNNIKKIMKTDSNSNNNVDLDDDGNNSCDQIVAQCRDSGKVQVSNTQFEYMTNIKKQPSINRKSFTPPMNATSSLVLGETASKEGNSSGEDNMLKNITKQSRTPSSERSPKHNQGTTINLSSSQTTKNSDRACSPDSGLSLSATSAEKESNNLSGRDSKRETDSMFSRESLKDGRYVKEQITIPPRTPKRKKVTDSEEGSSHLTMKQRIKKEKESPVSRPSSRHKSADDVSLEAARMKILADMIKKLEDGSEENISMKDESHKPLSSSAVKTKRESKQEDSVSDSDLDIFKSKKMNKRKSNKFKATKSKAGEVDKIQQLDATSYFKHSAEKLSSSSTLHTGEKELDGNRKGLGEGNPVIAQAKISGKTPRRKSTTGTDGSSSKSVTQVKEKEYSEKKKCISSSGSENREANTLEKKSRALADKLLEQFLKRKSL